MHIDGLHTELAACHEVMGLCDSLPQKMQHEIMVPFGKHAFFSGQAYRTNEMLVQLGRVVEPENHEAQISSRTTDYWVEMTAAQAKAFLHRKAQRIEAFIEREELYRSMQTALAERPVLKDISEDTDAEVMGWDAPVAREVMADCGLQGRSMLAGSGLRSASDRPSSALSSISTQQPVSQAPQLPERSRTTATSSGLRKGFLCQRRGAGSCRALPSTGISTATQSHCNTRAGTGSSRESSSHASTRQLPGNDRSHPLEQHTELTHTQELNQQMEPGGSRALHGDSVDASAAASSTAGAEPVQARVCERSAGSQQAALAAGQCATGQTAVTGESERQHPDRHPAARKPSRFKQERMQRDRS